MERLPFSCIYFLMFVAYLIIPPVILYKLWHSRYSSLLKWLAWAITGITYIVTLFFIGSWPMAGGSFYFRYLFLAMLLITVAKSFYSATKSWMPIRKRELFTLSITLGVCGLQSFQLLQAYKSNQHFPASVELMFPLKGKEYYIAHGGNCLLTNHHYNVDAQKYALDILKLNRFGWRHNTFLPRSLQDYNIFEEPIYSPCNGTIVALEDDHPNLAPGTTDAEHLAGNHLVIAMDNSDIAILLAHIMPRSFTVKNGDVVTQGQLLAKVGNSGNTSEPHLHIHAVKMDTGDWLSTGTGVPMTFQKRFLVRNDRVR